LLHFAEAFCEIVINNSVALHSQLCTVVGLEI